MALDQQKIQDQLERLVASSEFARADRHARFLRFVVHKTLIGDLKALRERQIGIEVYERPTDWDPKLDNIVRGEARRLRAKLEAYRSVGGPAETVRITMPKGGYAVRFEELTAGTNVRLLPVLDAASEATVGAESSQRGGVRRTPLLVVSCLALAILAAVFIRSRSHVTAPSERNDDFRTVPFSTEVGQQYSPSISPDGKSIAFVWDGGQDGDAHIYIKSIAGNATPFTSGKASDTHPSWSPDGTHIAFVRFDSNETLVILKSVSGGTERVLRRMPYALSTWSSENPLSGCQTLGWFPGGDRLALTAALGGPKGYGILTISMATGEERIVTSPAGEDHDCYARVSPDGRTIAFIRYISHGAASLFRVHSDGTELKQLTFDNLDLRGLDWTSDGKKIVFASKQRGAFELRVIDPNGGPSVPLPSDSASISDPVVARSGNYVAFVESEENWNVWRAPIVNGHIGKPKRFLASLGLNHSPSYSPDGKSIAFVSDRSGDPEIWFSDDSGGHLKQMTHFGGPWLGTIRWSPDSSQIVFDARPKGHSGIFTMAAVGGPPKMLESDAFEDRRPSWSRDGNSIYYDSTRSGRPEIWKHSLVTGANSVVAPPPSLTPLESLDGTCLFYLDGDNHFIWISRVDGSDPRRLLQIKPDPELDWAMGLNDLYFTQSTATGAELLAYAVKGGRLRTIGNIPGTLSVGTPSLTLSPDGKWILFAMADHQHSDIKLRKGELP